MPISIDRFESDDLGPVPSLAERVLGFLASNPEQAFRRTEIATALDADPDAVSTALTRLADRSLARHRGEYWAVVEDLDHVRSACDLHRVTDALDDADGGIDTDAWDAAAPDGPHPSEQASDQPDEDG
ncbi:MAG: hypothetical protein ABEH59_12290 [Halobacteriales archaeon]